MARFKPVHRGLKLLPVDFDKQVLPGSFEHALCWLIDHEVDLGGFHARYRNAVEGAPAYDPAVLLKIILLAYSRGIVSSRRIEAACRENVLFIAVSGDAMRREEKASDLPAHGTPNTRCGVDLSSLGLLSSRTN